MRAQTRLPPVSREAPDEWVALVLGVGAYARSVNPNTVRLSGPDGEPVPVEVSSQRQGGSEHATTRLIVLRPTTPLTPAISYTATLSPEIEFVDGHRPESEWSFTFTAQCRLATEMDCGEKQGGVEPDAQGVMRPLMRVWPTRWCRRQTQLRVMGAVQRAAAHAVRHGL